MKLRYYMRGLGIGVIVAAILMGIALGGDKEKLTDAEIMARAKELGMVESSVLADLGKDKEQMPNQSTPSTEEDESKVEESQTHESQTGESEGESQGSDTESESQTGESQNVESGAGSQTGESQSSGEAEGESQVGESPDEDTKEEDKTQTQESQTEDDEQESNTSEEEEYVTLVIERGESSVSVSRSLEELGLVESAKVYDRYLCDNGYDKYIRVGTHKIKVGSTDEEIAETISRKKK